MELDKWIGSYKVRAFDWIDGNLIYVNVQYYKPGQSLSKPPIWDKTVYITDNIKGKRIICEYIDSLVNYIASFNLEANTKTILTF
jgi:hypothetical protein